MRRGSAGSARSHRSVPGSPSRPELRRKAVVAAPLAEPCFLSIDIVDETIKLTAAFQGWSPGPEEPQLAFIYCKMYVHDVRWLLGLNHAWKGQNLFEPA